MTLVIVNNNYNKLRPSFLLILVSSFSNKFLNSKVAYFLSLIASTREPMKDATISSCLLWFSCKPCIISVSFSPCFSIDSMLLLSEVASSSSPSSPSSPSSGIFLFRSFPGSAGAVYGVGWFSTTCSTCPTGAWLWAWSSRTTTRCNRVMIIGAWGSRTRDWRIGTCPCFDRVLKGNNISCPKNTINFVIADTFS